MSIGIKGEPKMIACVSVEDKINETNVRLELLNKKLESILDHIRPSKPSVQIDDVDNSRFLLIEKTDHSLHLVDFCIANVDEIKNLLFGNL